MIPRLLIEMWLRCFVQPFVGSTALLLGGLSAAGAIAGGVGASKAAGAQADAANQAANLQHQDAQAALDFQKQQYQNSLQMLNPYLQTGYGALDLLRTGLGIPGATPQGFTLNAGQQPFLGPQGGVGVGGSGAGSHIRFQAPAPNFDPMSAGGNFSLQDLSPGGRFATSGGTVARIDGGGLPGGGFGVNPGAGALNPIEGGGNLTASTNQGGTGQVPRLDASTPGGGTASSPNVGFGSLLSPFSEKFTAPTVTDDPGYKFRLQQGLDALTNSAAARGGLLSGGTLKATNDYAQGSASQEYSNAYNRALNEYLNRYNIFTGNQTNQFNKLAAISGLGQTSANNLSTAGLTTGANIGNTLLTSGQQIGNDLQNAGAARGSGYAGISNAVSGGLSSLGNLALLSQILGKNPSSNAGWGVV